MSTPESIASLGSRESVDSKASAQDGASRLWRYEETESSAPGTPLPPQPVEAEEPEEKSTFVKMFWSCAFTFITVAQLQFFYFCVKWWFPYPAAFLLMQFIVVLIIYYPFAFLGSWLGHRVFRATLPVVKPSPRIAYKVFPASIFFILALHGSLLLIQKFGPAAAEVAKGLAVLITSLLQLGILGKKIPLLSWLGIAVITAALATMSRAMSADYFLAGAVCSTFSSLRSVTASRQMKHVGNSGGEMTFYNAFNSILILVPIVVYLERPDNPEIFHLMFAPRNALYWGISGCVALLNNVSAFSLVASVTPTTYIIVSQAKHLATAGFDIALRPTQRTPEIIVSNLLKFGGGLVYAFGKHRARGAVELTPEQVYTGMAYGGKIYDSLAVRQEEESFLLLAKV